MDAVTRSKLPSEKKDGLYDTNWSGYTDLPCFSPRIASFDESKPGIAESQSSVNDSFVVPLLTVTVRTVSRKLNEMEDSLLNLVPLIPVPILFECSMFSLAFINTADRQRQIKGGGVQVERDAE